MRATRGLLVSLLFHHASLNSHSHRIDVIFRSINKIQWKQCIQSSQAVSKSGNFFDRCLTPYTLEYFIDSMAASISWLGRNRITWSKPPTLAELYWPTPPLETYATFGERLQMISVELHVRLREEQPQSRKAPTKWKQGNLENSLSEDRIEPTSCVTSWVIFLFGAIFKHFKSNVIIPCHASLLPIPQIQSPPTVYPHQRSCMHTTISCDNTRSRFYVKDLKLLYAS